jgi:hypothetical protein
MKYTKERGHAQQERHPADRLTGSPKLTRSLRYCWWFTVKVYTMLSRNMVRRRSLPAQAKSQLPDR